MSELAQQGARIPVVEIVVSEPLDARSLPGLTATLAEVLRVHPIRLVVDLSDCPFMDAAGIAVLLEAHRRVRRDGGYLTLRGPSERLMRNLRLAHTDRVLDIASR